MSERARCNMSHSLLDKQAMHLVIKKFLGGSILFFVLINTPMSDNSCGRNSAMKSLACVSTERPTFATNFCGKNGEIACLYTMINF